jgi:hypothetical protein
MSRNVSRRQFMMASAAGLAAAGGLACTPGSPQAAAPAPLGVTEAVLDAFTKHKIVAIAETHGVQEFHDTLQRMISDPRFADAVDAIVVEFGNALHQDVIDRFVSGHPVTNPELRPVWQDTTQSPNETWDSPVYEQFYRVVRGVNWGRQGKKQLRVVLGDPPIDWTKVTKFADQDMFLRQRDTHMANVIITEVLNKNQKALVVAGLGHLIHYPDKTMKLDDLDAISYVERKQSIQAYVIGSPYGPLYNGLPQRLSTNPQPSVIPVAGSFLASVPDRVNGQGTTLSATADGVLYLGSHDLTLSQPNPAIYLNETYYAELQRRWGIGPHRPGARNLVDQLRMEAPLLYTGIG